ncbi:hypothetical protein ACIA5D_06400 [Actinoplanes sp. NPDC051513]|uniref:hypothetical protein n=1 Tax=Actinoplanes sp. NPDC051513 TaxID=3363908 RepID=UPI0037AD7E2B
MTKTASTLLLTALLAAGLAGCSAAGSSASPNPSASASANRQQLLSLGQEWVQCLRDHGLTRMPDAQLSQDGYLQFVPQRDYNWKEDLGKHRSIIDACQPIEDRYPPNAFRPKQQYTADDLRKLAEYAKCVRANGLPAFPDPNKEGEFDLSGTALANGVPGQLRDQADQACKSIWSGDVKITGMTGGKK